MLNYLEVAGGLVADTPGFSSLDLIISKKKNLSHYFIEMDEASAMCKFRGCLHLKEPNVQ